MMGNSKKITQAEVEKLCTMYFDCRLSVVEETELEYILGYVPYTSPIIKETKELMGLSHNLCLPEKRIRYFNLFSQLRTWKISAVAAVVLIIMSIGLFVQHHYIQSDSSVCYAYVFGEKVDGDKAQEIAMVDMARMKQFMEIVQHQQIAEKEKVNKFFNNSNFTK